MDLDNILNTHPNYDDVAAQSEYLFRSYIGGEVYREGQYLTHYIGEDSGPGDQYRKRLFSTHLDNHVQTTVDIYRSFLFREAPVRNLGKLLDNPLVNEWVMDTDQEGQGMNSFLKTANDLAMVMGSVWILVDKPSYKVETAAEEEQLGIRGYAAVYNPMHVLDWHYERNIAGKMTLRYYMIITEWSEEQVQRIKIQKDSDGNPEAVVDVQVFDNPLGYIPFIQHAPIKSPVKGVGLSIVSDVADAQRYIYNLLSELEQTIRISSHPTLVKTTDTSAAAGAGAIINMDIELDPGLRPYLLQPTSQGITGILDTVEKVSDSIKRMTHTSAVQAQRGTPISGVALQTERQLLNAKLSDIADTLQETELQLWKIWFDWQAIDQPEDFSIEYSKSFDMRDNHAEVELYKKALELVPHNRFQHSLHEEIAKMLIADPERLNKVMDEMKQDHNLDEE